jgi:hypothetical protein
LGLDCLRIGLGVDLNDVGLGARAIAQIRGGLYIGIGLFAKEYICGFE